MDVLARARAYRDAYVIRRQRSDQTLVDLLHERYVFDYPESGGYDEEMIDDVAELMIGHPSVWSVEADYDGETSTGYAIASGRMHRALVRVDVEPDGTLRLSLPE